MKERLKVVTRARRAVTSLAIAESESSPSPAGLESESLGSSDKSESCQTGLDSDSAMARLVTARRACVTAFSLSFYVLLVSKFKITKPTSYTLQIWLTSNLIHQSCSAIQPKSIIILGLPGLGLGLGLGGSWLGLDSSPTAPRTRTWLGLETCRTRTWLGLGKGQTRHYMTCTCDGFQPFFECFICQ